MQKQGRNTMVRWADQRETDSLVVEDFCDDRSYLNRNRWSLYMEAYDVAAEGSCQPAPYGTAIHPLGAYDLIMAAPAVGRSLTLAAAFT